MRNLKQFIILTFENNQVRIWELTISQLRELDKEEFEQAFVTGYEIISVQKVGDTELMLATTDQVSFVDFNFESKVLKNKQTCKFAKVLKVVTVQTDFVIIHDKE